MHTLVFVKKVAAKSCSFHVHDIKAKLLDIMVPFLMLISTKDSIYHACLERKRSEMLSFL